VLVTLSFTSVTDTSQELPRRLPRDQVVSDAKVSFDKALLDFEKRHRLDSNAAATLVAMQVSRAGRVARGDEPRRIGINPGHGLTGIPAEINYDLNQLVEQCWTGDLVYDEELPRLAFPQYAVREPLTDAEMLYLLSAALTSITGAQMRVERGGDLPHQADPDSHESGT
jgi:hypothetical protein